MKKRTLFAFLVAGGLSASACSNSNSSALLTRSHAATSECPSGGIVIDTGLDQNNNGVLEDNEVTQTTPVCNGTGTTGMTGATGQPTLIESTTIPVGDKACPEGGSKLSIGLDNGNGGGTAGDGILQSGEVTTTKSVCNFSVVPHVGMIGSPPESPAGAFTIDSTGGNGTTGPGGYGREIYAGIDSGSAGGHLKVYKTGVADSSFTVPTIPFVAGDVPATIAMDTTWNKYPSEAAGITSGDEVFVFDSGYRLFIRKNVNGVSTPLTSLDVAAGKTLTLPINTNGAHYWLYETHFAVRNAGTIITARQADGKSAPTTLEFPVAEYIGLEGSLLSNAGNDAAGSTGGNAGGINLASDHNIINQGTITTAGGNGDTGGAAGSLNLYASASFVNTGTITTRGGNSAVNGGRNGGDIQIYGYDKAFFSSGTIDSSGSDAGTTGNGGRAGLIQLHGNATSAMKLSGTISAKGGTCNGVNCAGGQGMFIRIYAEASPFFTTATMDTSGGDGKGTGNGGIARDISISGGSGEGNGGNVSLPAASMQISGNLHAKGGNGASGAQGGYINVTLDASNAPLGQELTFLGYTTISSTGGDSVSSSGGEGGQVYFYNGVSYPNPGGDVPGPSGSVVNYADMTSKGGNGATGGGSGNYVELYTQTDFNFGDDFERIYNYGTLSSIGGNSTGAAGGYGGSASGVFLVGISGVTNEGALNVLGGSSAGTSGYGGYVYEAYLSSDAGPVSNKGAITSSGGSATAASGHGYQGGGIYMYGVGVTTSGALVAKGGDGGAVTGGYGGNGGYIEIVSNAPGAPTSSSSTYDVTGGAGISAAGSKGSAKVDGVDVTP